MRQIKPKIYQEEVLGDLKNYMYQLRESDNLRKAFQNHWLSRNLDPDTKTDRWMHKYNNTAAPGIPNVTLKVPTAGGKTYIAALSLPIIFDYLPEEQPKVVAWFVPSDSIREQTLRNLQTPGHPYHSALQKMGRTVMVADKEQALMGTNLSPAEVEEQLTVLVLSAQSFATKKGDDLRSWRQNAAFAQWDNHYHYSTEERIEGADELSLIQWLAWQHPVCIVDESHNFGSEMRTEMLRMLNPSIILNLTATPKPESNIISFVDAGKLKKESMVKLPVVLYNMESTEDVIINAKRLQESLERHAKQYRNQSGYYIRPIVLLQVEPRTGKEDANFQLVKQALLKIGIPEEQVKLKLADPHNELKGVDLMAPDCPVRYIITVNALKEGWDCPFAYILAALSNRTSPIDVEQVLGRILRQPNATRTKDPLLDECYVLTAKQDFYAAAEAVIHSLVRSGYSRRDYREAQTDLYQNETPSVANEPSTEPIQTTIWEEPGGELKLDLDKVAEKEKELYTDIDTLEQRAIEVSQQYEEEINQFPQNEITPMVENYPMRKDVREVAQSIRIPLFSVENQTVNDFCPEPHILLTKETLNKDFKLLNENYKVKLIDSQSGVTSIDLMDSGDGQYTPKRTPVNKAVLNSLRQTFAVFSDDMKRRELTKVIVDNLRYNSIPHQDLITYVNRVLEDYNGEQLSDFYMTVKNTAKAFKLKIDDALELHRLSNLKKWLASRYVQMNCYYEFPHTQSVAKPWQSVDCSLYIAEEKPSDFEERIINKIAQEENVHFWHRNPEGRKNTLTLNGFLYHQPDFVVVLRSGDVMLLETKGEAYLNEDSKRKMELGELWEKYANMNGGGKFHYYMVFEEEHDDYEKALSVAEIIDLIRQFKQ